MRRLAACLCIATGILALAGAAAADWRHYEVKIETKEDVVLGMDQTVAITIEPADEVGDLIPLANFDLTIAYDADHLQFNGARAGQFLTGCGWEYFNVEELPGTFGPCEAGGPQLKLIHLFAWADWPNPPHPSCNAPAQVSTLAELGFSVVQQQLPGGTYLPIQFYWPDDDYPAECLTNSFYHIDITNTFIADQVLDHLGQPRTAGTPCSGPDPACDGWANGHPYIDFQSGGMLTHLALRGDVNWNSLAFEIADYVHYTYAMMYGTSVFTHNPLGQIMSTDIDCDGFCFTIADYVMFQRIFFNLYPEWPCPGDGFGKSGMMAGSMQLFAEGRSGKTGLPVELFVSNDAAAGGLQARFEYDPDVLTPVIDPDCYYCGDGISVAHEVIGRAWDVYNTGTIRVVTPEEGAVAVRFVPGDSRTPLAPGDDMVLRIHFDVAEGLAPYQGCSLSLVEAGYDYDVFATTGGELFRPDLLPGAFTVTADELVFPGGEGHRGDTNVPLNFQLVNDETLVGLTARVTYDAAVLTPHFLTGNEVRHYLAGRAYGYDGLGTVSVTSDTAGELVISLTPPESGAMPEIGPGNDTFIRVYFDVTDGLLRFPPVYPVDFADGEDVVNELLTADGHSVFPNLTGGDFAVVPEDPLPSCPVLFAHDGQGFVPENPLLTACEQSGYAEVVTDHYHVTAAVAPQDGAVRFQLREMEDEITHLESLELITADHDAGTEIACTADGRIVAFRGAAAPVRAVDQDGVDRLAELRAVDGLLFSADGPGHLLVTFRAGADADGSLVQLTASSKARCEIIEPLDPRLPLGGDAAGGRGLIVEVRDESGAWLALPDLPPREWPASAAFDLAAATGGKAQEITVRISWRDGYVTDAVRRLLPASEAPMLRTWPLAAERALSAAGEPRDWTWRDGRRVLQLVKGDVLDFSFACGEAAEGLARDYVIRAVGRYEPDYDARPDLVPAELRLHDAYPNPFNPSTRIGYDLPRSMHVTLEVYDVQGRRVATLVNGLETAGRHTVVWEGRDDTGRTVAGGMYLYSLTTEELTQAKKMLLLK